MLCYDLKNGDIAIYISQGDLSLGPRRSQCPCKHFGHSACAIMLHKLVSGITCASSAAEVEMACGWSPCSLTWYQRCLRLVSEKVHLHWNYFSQKIALLIFVWAHWLRSSASTKKVGVSAVGAVPCPSLKVHYFPLGMVVRNGLVWHPICTHTGTLSLCDSMQMAYPSEPQLPLYYKDDSSAFLY